MSIYSLGLLHDQFPNCDRDDWLACPGENLHVQEVDPLPQLDWSANQGSVLEATHATFDLSVEDKLMKHT